MKDLTNEELLQIAKIAVPDGNWLVDNEHELDYNGTCWRLWQVIDYVDVSNLSINDNFNHILQIDEYSGEINLYDAGLFKTVLVSEVGAKISQIIYG